MKFTILFTIIQLLILVAFSSWSSGAFAVNFDSADEYYEDALKNFRDKDYSSAIIQLKNALRLDDEHLPAKILLGESLLASGEPQAAEAQLLRARKQGADENLIAVPIANSLLSQSKYSELEDYVARARRSAKIDSKLHVILGISYTQQQKFDDADIAFSTSRILDPENPEPLLAQGSIALNKDELDKVEELVMLVENIAPGNIDLLLLKGDLHSRRNEPGQALEAYNAILQQNSEYVIAILRRARILLDRGEYEKVIADLKPLWEEELYDPEAIYLYSMALARGGNTKLATRVLDEASRKIDYLGANIVDKHPTLALLSATIAYHRGEKLKALEAAEKLIETLPSHSPSRMLLARIHMDLEQYEEVVNTLDPVTHRNENNLEFLTIYGRALMKLEQHSKAIRFLEAAARINPQPAFLSSEIALAKMAIGKTDEALGELQQHYDAGDYNTRAAVLLAFSHLSSGKVTEADNIGKNLLERDAENPVVHNLLGTVAAARGQVKAAKLHFQNALLADDTFVPALMNLVKFDIRENQLESAETRLQKVLQLDPDSREAMAGMARLSESRGDMHASSQWLEKLWLKHPDAVMEIFQLVNLYRLTDQEDKALRTIKKLQDENNKDFDVLMAYLDTHIALGKSNEAREMIDRRLRYTVDFSVPQLTQIAKVQVQVEDLQGAQNTLLRCLLQEPGYIAAKTDLIKLETQLRNYDRALTLAEEIIEAMPDSPLGYGLKGDVLIFAGRDDEALKIFQAALQKWPSTALHLKIVKQQIAKDPSINLLKPLEDWVTGRDEDVEALFGLAVSYIDVGAYDRAISTHQALLQKLPGDASIHNNLAWLYQRKNDKRALRHAEMAYKLAPNDADVLDTYGWVLAESGQLDMGLSFIRKALSRASSDPAARYHLALVLSKLDRRLEARDALRNLLSENIDFREIKEATALLQQLEKS